MDLDLWEKIIYELNGSCDTLESVLKTNNAMHLENDSEFLLYLDDHIFRCEQCGWWSDLSEMADTNDAWICKDCESVNDDY